MDSPELESDKTMLDSYTVTIALDSDDQKIYVHDPHLSSGIDDCEEPPQPESICAKLDEKIRISRLPANVFKILSLFLNSDAIGSLKNWEHLAAQFGLSHNEIRNLRRSEDPTESVLMRFPSLSVNRLMEYLCEMERIDLLISLKPYVEGLTASMDALQNEEPSYSDSGVFQEAGPSMRPQKSQHNQPRITAHPLVSTSSIFEPVSKNLSVPTEDFVLVTHYERPTNKDMKKLFKYFMKNLRHYATKSHSKVLDINECIDESNIRQIVDFFTPAKHVILFATREYADIVVSKMNETSPDATLITAKHLHELMSDEYYQNNSTNRRFRVVLPSDEQKTCLPLGWATNTLVYKFPENFNELCVKLFENGKNGKVKN